MEYRSIMSCGSCPYGKGEFKSRMFRYNKTIAEQGIPNDIYGYLEPQDASDEFEEHLQCDKTGGKIWLYGRCEDAYSEILIHKNRSNKKKRNKRERFLKHRKHLKDLAENAFGRAPVDYLDEIWISTENGIDIVKNPKPYYKKRYRGKTSKYLKRQSNKKIRRYKGELHNGYQCHRLFDFWWKLY